MEAPTTIELRAYAPSWLDRFDDAVARTGLPSPFVYLLPAIAVLALLLVAEAGSETSRPLTFTLLLSTGPWVQLWAIRALDAVAARALDDARPKLAIDDAAFAELRYELTTMPARPAVVVTIAGALIAGPVVASFATEASGALMSLFGIGRDTLSIAVFGLSAALNYATGSLFFYHAARQLRLVRRIHRDITVVDLFDLGPVHALSRVSAFTALGIQVGGTLWLITNPATVGNLVPVGVTLVLSALALYAFIVPLWGIRGRIAAEKSRVMSANARLRERLMTGIREDISAGRFDAVGQAKDAVLALEVEARALSDVRTWPWAPETARLLVSAIFLPTTIFALELVVREVLGA